MTMAHAIRKALSRAKRAFFRRNDSRLELLNRLPRGGVCAEIGVWKGDFSERILAVTAPRALHLVDPWQFQPEFPERMYGGKVAKGQGDMDTMFEQVRERFRGRTNVEFHRGYSDSVLTQFNDGYFDWVYIDGNHYYEYVRRDLDLAFQKVRPGGYITGDDYNWGEDIGFPVRRAVESCIQQYRPVVAPEVLGTQFLLVKNTEQT